MNQIKGPELNGPIGFNPDAIHDILSNTGGVLPLSALMDRYFETIPQGQKVSFRIELGRIVPKRIKYIGILAKAWKENQRAQIEDITLVGTREQFGQIDDLANATSSGIKTEKIE